jgi:hypothetical protein
MWHRIGIVTTERRVVDDTRGQDLECTRLRSEGEDVDVDAFKLSNSLFMMLVTRLNW